MDMLLEEYDFSYFIPVILLTIIPFFWLFKADIKKIVYFSPFLFFTFVYSGIGIGWGSVDKFYIFYYAIYILLFSAAAYLAQRHSKVSPSKEIYVSNRISLLIEKYGTFFITFYLLTNFIPIIYPNFNLINLISPPRYDLSELFNEGYSEKSPPLLLSLMNYIGAVLMLFYYVSLYKYIFDLKRLAVLMFLPHYFSIASGYVSRSAIMCSLMIFVIIFLLYYPQYRKRVLLIGILVIPFLIFGLAAYTYYRQGIDEVNLSLGDAFKFLFYSETNYPKHFSEIIKIDKSLVNTYFEWLLNLPLPGFMKISHGDYDFNGIFSEVLSGIPRGESTFNVLLPGVVGESIFIFGPKLFWVHAIIYGLIIGKVYKLLYNRNEIMLFLYYSCLSAYTISRAGTVSMYPFYIKHLLIYLIVRCVIVKYKYIRINGKRIL